MIKEKKKTVTITEERTIQKSCICDICGKTIYTDNQPDEYGFINVLGRAYISYYTVIAGHHDWRNDSGDSIETFDICSTVCLRSKIEEYISKTRNTEYIKINHKKFWGETDMIKEEEKIVTSIYALIGVCVQALPCAF